MSVEVLKVNTSRELDVFINLSRKIYYKDKNWVPMLDVSEKKLLNRKVHPFHKHAEVEYFLTRKDGEFVGRICAIVNHNHNSFHNEKTGFFGFFECINDLEVAKELFSAAETWLVNKGMQIIRGPCNFSTNETCGLLVDGFNYPPVFMMPYNPQYYQYLIEQNGYKKAMDLLAFFIPAEMVVKEKFERIVSSARNKQNIRVRSADIKEIKREMQIIMDIYNDAWSRNWGFVPMTNEEINFMVRELKPIIRPEFVLIAEYDTKPVGFALAIPDINPILKRINGRLLPLGWLYLLLFARKVPFVRMITLGVKRQFQGVGIASHLIYSMIEKGMQHKIKAGELSWVLETNQSIIGPILAAGAKPYKTYRIYERKLT